MLKLNNYFEAQPYWLRFLYIFFTKANINHMIVAVIALIFAVILLSPILLSAQTYFCGETKTLHYTVVLYNIVKITRGRAIFKNKEIVFSMFKKEHAIKYKKLIRGEKKLKIFTSLDITHMSALLEIGSIENEILPILIGSIYNALVSSLIGLIKEKNKLLDATNKVEIYQAKSLLNYNFNVSFCFNAVMLLYSIIKNFMENILDGKEK